MTELLHNPKIKPEHLARKAIVYLRQSSDKQVRQNKESQLLQYAMAERVRALGWQEVEIINNDLGSSAGLAAAQRPAARTRRGSTAPAAALSRARPATRAPPLPDTSDSAYCGRNCRRSGYGRTSRSHSARHGRRALLCGSSRSPTSP